jgi:hypothetical protein
VTKHGFEVLSVSKQAILAAAFLLLGAAPAVAATGTVVRRISSCDYFMVETPKGFSILEWFGGHDPDKGDKIVGAYESYGMKTVYDATADEEVRVWVEDYYLTKDSALEKLMDKCE